MLDSNALSKAIREAEIIQIASGEGCEGTMEDYEGIRSIPAIRYALKQERCNGDRWATVYIDGRACPEL
jgi:hypothetical protein